MSIMKNRYYNTGGFLPGLPAQQALQNRLATGQPFTPVTGDYDTDIGSIIDWTADPRNVPQYYTGNTVAEFDPLQEQAHRAGVGAASTYDALTDSLLSEYDAQLDPSSALNQAIASEAAQGASNAFFGAGTPGSARGQIAANIAAQDAVRRNRESALDNIAAQRQHLTGGAEILNQIGTERQARAQDVINEDIKRFNWAQLSPQQQQDRLISLLTARAGLNATEAEAAANEALFGGFLGQLQGLTGQTNSQFADNVLGLDPNGGGIFSLLSNPGVASGVGNVVSGVASGIGNVFSSIFNDGGVVPGQPGMHEDPMMANDPMMDPMAAGGVPMAPEMPMMEAPMGEGIMGMSMMSSEPMSAVESLKAMAEAQGLNVKVKTKKK